MPLVLEDNPPACPNCGAAVDPPDAVYCLECGDSIAQPGQAPATRPAHNQTQICRHCLMQIPAGATVCAHCRRSIKGRGGCIGCMAAMLFAGVACLVVYPPLAVVLLVIGFVMAAIEAKTHRSAQ